MDILNNVNVVIGIIVGFFGIGAYLFGIVTYLRGKAALVQQKQTKQLQASHKGTSSSSIVVKSLSKLDWMEVLWLGFEDCVKAREGAGVFTSIIIGIIGGFVMAAIAAGTRIHPAIVFVAFYLLFLSANLVFYIYFVGRRLEKKLAEINP